MDGGLKTLIKIDMRGGGWWEWRAVGGDREVARGGERVGPERTGGAEKKRKRGGEIVEKVDEEDNFFY